MRSHCYPAGDAYDIGGVKGIVFDTYYDNGFHGKIAAYDSMIYAAVWSTETIMTGATDWDDGRKNMEIIMRRHNWYTLYPAFARCADIGDGWYLPSIYELYAIISKANPSISRNIYFWSSTEYDYGYSYYNNYNYRLKSEQLHIIPAYAF